MAAAFTRMSTPPSAPDSSATMARTDSSSPVSHERPTTRRPVSGRQFRRRVGDALLVASRDPDVGSLQRELAHDRFADPAAAAGDDRLLARELQVHAAHSTEAARLVAIRHVDLPHRYLLCSRNEADTNPGRAGGTGRARGRRGGDRVAQNRSDDRTTSVATTGVVTTVPPSTIATTATVSTLPSGIAELPVAEPSHEDSYNRNLFGSGWIDTDHDCQNTRAEVLIAESRGAGRVHVTNATARSQPATGSTRGRARSSRRPGPWTSTTRFRSRNAWRSGAWAWTTEQRRAYANDLTDVDHLVALALGENRSKGDGGPEGWKPPNPGTWCEYARDWTAIKAKWNLTATPAEWSALLAMSATCL